jgi:hypothetical protein
MATVPLEPGISASGYVDKESTVPSTYLVGLQQVPTNIRPPSINTAGTPVTVLIYFTGLIQMLVEQTCIADKT